MQHPALHNRLQDLAADVGRLRRCAPEDSVLEWRTKRIAGHVEALFGFVEPTAAELAAEYAPGDEAALIEAIRIVDQRARKLLITLGSRRDALLQRGLA